MQDVGLSPIDAMKNADHVKSVIAEFKVPVFMLNALIVQSLSGVAGPPMSHSH